jgi:hypothetical protein
MRKLLLALVFLFAVPHVYAAGPCAKSAANPNNTGLTDGTPVPCYEDGSGNQYVVDTIGGVAVSGTNPVPMAALTQGSAIASRSFQGTASASAVAATFATVQLFNPLGSGRTVVVSQINAAVGAASIVRMVFQSSNRTTSAGSAPNVKASGSASAAVMYTDNIGALVAGIYRFSDSSIISTTVQGSPLVNTVSYVLPPGQGIEVECETANTALSVIFMFSEF